MRHLTFFIVFALYKAKAMEMGRAALSGGVASIAAPPVARFY